MSPCTDVALEVIIPHYRDVVRDFKELTFNCNISGSRDKLVTFDIQHEKEIIIQTFRVRIYADVLQMMFFLLQLDFHFIPKCIMKQRSLINF